MKVAMKIDPKTALLAGKNSYGWQFVDIDPGHLPEELRAVLAKHPRNDGSYSRDPDAPFVLHTTDQAEATQESLVAELSLRIAKQKAREEEERRCEEEEVQRLLTAPIEELVQREYNCGRRYWNLGYHLDRNKDPRLETRKAEAKAECERLNVVEQKKAREEQEQRLIAEEARDKARREELQPLLDWATTNGSELLKERVAGGYEWEGLARQEYTDWACADITLERIDDPDDTEDRTTPTLEEIRTLKGVQEVLKKGKASAHASLVWIGSYVETATTHQTAVAVMVQTPDLEIVCRYYKV